MKFYWPGNEVVLIAGRSVRPPASSALLRGQLAFVNALEFIALARPLLEVIRPYCGSGNNVRAKFSRARACSTMSTEGKVYHKKLVNKSWIRHIICLYF